VRQSVHRIRVVATLVHNYPPSVQTIDQVVCMENNQVNQMNIEASLVD
jgi:hypothetical protein